MTVRPAIAPDFPTLHRLYVDAVLPQMHGFPPSEEAFAEAFCEAPDYLRDSQILVVGREAPVGFLRAGIYLPVFDRWSLAVPGVGMLFGPFFAAGAEEPASEMLRVALEDLRNAGVQRCLAFDPVESMGAPWHNAGWGGLSEKSAAIVNLLARQGFRIEHRELALTLPLLRHEVAPDPPSGFTLSREARVGVHRYTVRLLRGRDHVGSCHFSTLHPSRTENSAGEREGYIDGLEISSGFQGNGLGRLLMLHALQKLAEVGCGKVGLTTAQTNLRAQNLYYSLGFGLVDSYLTLSASFRR